MSITTLSSQELDKDIERAKEASQKGPVFITEHGEATLVLLSIEEYKRLTRPRRNIADSLSMPEVADIEFNPPRVNIETKEVDFS